MELKPGHHQGDRLGREVPAGSPEVLHVMLLPHRWCKRPEWRLEGSKQKYPQCSVTAVLKGEQLLLPEGWPLVLSLPRLSWKVREGSTQ